MPGGSAIISAGPCVRRACSSSSRSCPSWRRSKPRPRPVVVARPCRRGSSLQKSRAPSHGGHRLASYFHQRQGAFHLALHDGVLVAPDRARFLGHLLLEVLVELLDGDDAVLVEV